MKLLKAIFVFLWPRSVSSLARNAWDWIAKRWNRALCQAYGHKPAEKRTWTGSCWVSCKRCGGDIP